MSQAVQCLVCNAKELETNHLRDAESVQLTEQSADVLRYRRLLDDSCCSIKHLL